MKTLQRNTLFLSLAVGLLTAPTTASAWVGKAKSLFENDEYQSCIAHTKTKKKDNFGLMFLTFSHLQEHVFNRTDFDKAKFKAYKSMLEARLGAKDIDHLLYFINLNDKPKVVGEARKLAKKAFKNISRIEEVPRLLTYLKSTDPQSRKLALGTIKRIFSPKRKYVNEGGTMRAKDVRVMGSKDVITSLLANVAEGDARKSLETIEEPVLKYTGDFPGPATAKLETNITKKITKRKKKFPNSNWYSATGKTR